MHVVGAPHLHKIDAQVLLERSIAAGQRLVTDAEVLQEILHRYTAIDRRDAIRPALETLLGFVDEVFPIDQSDVLRASELLRDQEGLSTRDALHLVVMRRYRVKHIMSFDSDFDRWPGITRLHSV
jgi:predicted nucleic acid-binding protein